MAENNFWSNLGDAVNYARATSTLDGGGAYYVTQQAKEDLREQGKEDEARQIEKAEAIGTVGGAIAGLTLGNGIPALWKGIQTFRAAHPIISGVIDAGLTIDGVRNALSNNGIKKTFNYIKDGNWGRAGLSGTMDMLDLLGGVGLVGDATRYSKKAANRFLESLVRIGDDFATKPISSTTTQLFNNRAKGLRYILFNNPDLVYQLPYNYSGQQVLRNLNSNNPSPAHKGDLIDVLFGKSNELVDANGRVLATMSTNVSNIPEKTIQAFQTIPGQSNTLPRVLRFINGEAFPLDVYKPIQSNGDLVTGIPQEIERANIGEIYFTQVPFLTSAGIDPGHFGITAVKNSNGVNFFGHDVYHFSPGLYAKTHRSSRMIPRLNMTVGQPFIAEWQIPKVTAPLDPKLKNLTIPVEGVTYNSDGHSMIYRPPWPFSKWDLISFQKPPNIFQQKRGSLFHKSGGTIKIKKKNIGSFTRYCNGKVTEECIRKGKNSSNPTTRKRANFAWVARHKFKHEEGGKINYLNMF